MKSVEIIKANGDRELFDPTKLEISLKKAGADKNQIKEIVNHIEKELVDEMTTQRIYEHAHFLLKKANKSLAAKYSLKRAISDLGPSGFPFERFIAEIFKYKGFTARTGLMLAGGCIEHEVDVMAENKEKLVVVEAKFHNQVGTKSDSKVPLYVKSRIEDLRQTKYDGNLKEGIKDEPWIITNTRFTKSALEFGMCTGIKMVDWSNPKGGSLPEMIEETDLHPVTVITSLSKEETETLLRQNIVLCRSLSENTELLKSMGLNQERVEEVITEIKGLRR